MSETPQSDPRQAFGDSRPTQPLGQAAPAWGPVAQGPGQAPPPMPGQVPGQVPPPMPGQVPPPVPPVAPSAWSQPVPAGGPGGGPDGGRRGWLIGGAAALAVAVIVGVAVTMSGGDDDTASGPPSGVPGGVAEPDQPTGKAYTKAPKGCELVKAATVTGIIPGAACTPGLFDDKDLASMITRSPGWERADSGGPFQTLDVHLSIGPGADDNYDMKKQSALKDMGTLRKVIDSRPVSGLGEEAFVVYAGDSEGSLTQAQVIVREGNAVVTTDYTFSRKDSTTTQKQAEDAAVAVSRDVFAALS
ncbi:hypothetical protein OG357_08620 [Streptomyces sp. NBC_01255]|uniref:hypothetical protein n=1 Tax=Streptomyces sp. NBC_01255 TaxID=2903798 RepID=UPI002E35BCB8|nr:hypothetical protein [Streptomyces sp. NBC_01255]